MAQALTVTVDSVFDASLPVSLHALGVPGYANRYVADTLGGGNGTLIDAWTDQAGELNLTAASAAQRPTLGSAGGTKFVSFDGSTQGLKGSFTAGKIKTLAMVVRPNGAAGSANYLIFNGDVLINKHVGEQAGMYLAGGGSQLNTPSNTLPAGQWGIVIAVVDGARSVIRANGSASPFGTDKSTGVMSRYALGRDAGAFAYMDIAELTGWDTALTAQQCATVLTNLRTRYASIL